MSGTLFGAFVPVVSVLVGGGITYWLNVLARRRAHVEDQFNTAIAAVAVADASRHYLRSVGRPVGLSDAQYHELLADITKAAVENHCQRAGEAREALARIMQYDSGARPFYQDAQAVTDHPEDITAFLVEAKGRATRRRRVLKQR